ncbi:hypothetical protein AK812_SmicGene174 [Symbiodinium microadriaticum]|uniref:Uncharacterized protein n=1 Tax=Symbiodinium microadriaticum TaxID=2951 RepID=A0A1Q9F722_SYMMI|nr:hypothetical protein AK812_SmicGene174 [Symbiodinium microadriaticum]
MRISTQRCEIKIYIINRTRAASSTNRYLGRLGQFSSMLSLKLKETIYAQRKFLSPGSGAALRGLNSRKQSQYDLQAQSFILTSPLGHANTKLGSEDAVRYLEVHG